MTLQISGRDTAERQKGNCFSLRHRLRWLFLGPLCVLFAIPSTTVYSSNSWGMDLTNPGGSYFFLEQFTPLVGGYAQKSRVVYINDRGLVQRYSLKDRAIVLLAHGSVEAESFFASLSAKAAILAREHEMRQSTESEPISEFHPPRTNVYFKLRDGVEYRWSGKTDAISDQLSSVIEASKALACNTKGRSVPRTDCFIKATLLDEQTIKRFQKDGMFNQIEHGESEVCRCMYTALGAPYQLIPVPKQENPFVPFHTRFRPGNFIEISRSNVFYQVISYSVCKDTLDLK